MLAIVISDTKKEGFSAATPPEETMLEMVQTRGKMRKAQLPEVKEPQANPHERLTKRKRLPNDRQTTTKRRVSWILFYFCDKTP